MKRSNVAYEYRVMMTMLLPTMKQKGKWGVGLGMSLCDRERVYKNDDERVGQ